MRVENSPGRDDKGQHILAASRRGIREVGDLLHVLICIVHIDSRRKNPGCVTFDNESDFVG